MRFTNLASMTPVSVKVFVLVVAVMLQACVSSTNTPEPESLAVNDSAAKSKQSEDQNNKEAEANGQSNDQSKDQAKDQANKQPDLTPFKVKPTPLKNELQSATKASYQSALTALANKKWQAAITTLNGVIALHPDLSVAHLNKALALFHLSKFDTALQSIKSAESINNDNPYLYNLKGVIAREKGDFATAEAAYLKAITLWPNYAEAHLNLAVMFEIYRGRFTDAKKHYQLYLALQPDDKKAQQWLAGLEIKLASRKGN